MRKSHLHITTLTIALLLLLTSCQGLLAPPEVLPTRVILPSQTPSPAPTATPGPLFQTVAPLPSSTPPATPTRAATGTPLPAGTPTLLPLGVANFPPDVNPLTGLKVANPAILNRRPVMVKVSNYPRTGRPHAGLSAADIVFEYYIGEFENRFLAVYYSQDSNWIGPLRSGRLVDAQLTNQYGGILVYGNADPRVDKVLVDSLGKRAITFDDAPCPPICGKETHSIEGVFVNSGATTQFAIAQKIDNARPDLNGMLFDVRPPSSQTTGEFLGVMFGPENRGEWRYDAARGLYMRWIEEQRSNNVFVQVPLVDRNTYKQIGFENVIVLFTHYTELLPTMFEMEVAGNTTPRRAVFFRDGKMTEGLWLSNGADHPLSLMSSWGISYILKPGRSWIILVGLNSTLIQDSLSQWELEYHTQ
jgi:hypothetical protein